ncbi:MAG: YkgJ family cysteine cluster protein [Saprospiraceae bacterium]
MKDLIEHWKLKKDAVKKPQQQFVRQLKRKKRKEIDELADQLHQEVFQEIDCLDCANCCTSIPPLLTRTDISRIAKHLGMKTAEFQEQYAVQDEDGDIVMNASPCPFLQADHACMIYEHRPKACRQYPHTNQQAFMQNLKLHATNAQYCPAVFHILERMMKVR